MKGFPIGPVWVAIVGASVLPSQLNALSATPAPTQFCGCPSASGSVSNLGPPAPKCSTTACSGGPAGLYVQVNASLNHTVILSTSWGIPATFNAKAVVRVQ
jgi:hypothetical protein